MTSSQPEVSRSQNSEDAYHWRLLAASGKEHVFADPDRFYPILVQMAVSQNLDLQNCLALIAAGNLRWKPLVKRSARNGDVYTAPPVDRPESRIARTVYLRRRADDLVQQALNNFKCTEQNCRTEFAAAMALTAEGEKPWIPDKQALQLMLNDANLVKEAWKEISHIQASDLSDREPLHTKEEDRSYQSKNRNSAGWER